jgi:catechol 2,3-dioxygenase-like lactoylglutathione lyase family enzyme
MTIRRMDHVGIVVDELAAAAAFFVELGLKLQGEGQVEGGWMYRVVGLEGLRAGDRDGGSELGQSHARTRLREPLRRWLEHGHGGSTRIF